VAGGAILLWHVSFFADRAGRRGVDSTHQNLGPTLAFIAGMRLLVAVLLFTTAVSAQRYSGSGHVFYAPGVSTDGNYSNATQTVGVGGEALVYKGVGVGGDVGFSWPGRHFRSGIGIASLNGSYHFVDRDRPRRTVPFLTAGYGALFRSDYENAFNFGGGITHWFGDHTGVRLEFRDHIMTSYRDVHFITFRIGFAFR
jgi:hypothetical protein